jgi:hypothetical protein
MIIKTNVFVHYNLANTLCFLDYIIFSFEFSYALTFSRMFACNWAPSKYTATHPMAKRAMGCGFSLGFRVCALVASTQPRNQTRAWAEEGHGLTV